MSLLSLIQPSHMRSLGAAELGDLVRLMGLYYGEAEIISIRIGRTRRMTWSHEDVGLAVFFEFMPKLWVCIYM